MREPWSAIILVRRCRIHHDEYVLNLLPRGTHDYEKFIKPSELSLWGREAGLSVAGIKGMSYSPLTKHYWLGEDVSVNYIMHTLKV